MSVKLRTWTTAGLKVRSNWKEVRPRALAIEIGTVKSAPTVATVADPAVRVSGGGSVGAGNAAVKPVPEVDVPVPEVVVAPDGLVPARLLTRKQASAKTARAIMARSTPAYRRRRFRLSPKPAAPARPEASSPSDAGSGTAAATTSAESG